MSIYISNERMQWALFLNVTHVQYSFVRVTYVRIKLQVSFAECRLFYRVLLQKRPIILATYVRSHVHMCIHIYIYIYTSSETIHQKLFSMHVTHVQYSFVRATYIRSHMYMYMYIYTSCETMQQALFWIIVRHRTTQCITLQHTATHCNTHYAR